MILTDIYNLLVTQPGFFWNLTIQHLEISFIVITIAIILGLSIGIIIAEYPRNKWVLSVVDFIYTIPSIALFGFLIPLCGIGDINAIVALTVYALLPMVRGTHTGIVNINKEIIEAAEGMGSTKKQVLFEIKLPLALPQIMSAIRTMVIMTIALTGIAAFIGAGGLGVAIYRGITTNNIVMTVTGSLLIAALAVVVDWILGRLEKITEYTRPRSDFELKSKKLIFNKKTLTAVVIVILCVFAASQIFGENTGDTIHIATKPMTEQYIMGDMLQELIEHDTNLKVDLTTGVGGGTSNIQPGMLNGEFDLYPEYTGTGWMEVLKEKGVYNESEFSELQSEYNKNYNLSWVGMYGFDDTYGIAVTKEVANKYNLTTYSDLARVSGDLSFGAEPDFYQREDGYNALCEAYGMNFKSTTDLDIGLKYKAINEGKVDVINIFTTDGQLNNPNIVVLKDDKHFYPSYECGNVVSNSVLIKHPELKSVLLKLNNTITEKDMARMNYEVEVEKKDPKDVAHNYLLTKGLI
jgi:osmoprotectant transport system permease protein